MRDQEISKLRDLVDEAQRDSSPFCRISIGHLLRLTWQEAASLPQPQETSRILRGEYGYNGAADERNVLAGDFVPKQMRMLSLSYVEINNLFLNK